MTAMWSALPALLLLLGWSIFEPGYLDGEIAAALPAAAIESGTDVQLLINNVHLAISNPGIEPDPLLLPAIEAYAVCFAKGQSWMGTTGHGYSLKSPDGGFNGPMAGYGAISG